MISILLSIMNMALGGFVIKNLWLWFIAPLGVQPITLLHAYGINLLFNVLSFEIDSDKINRYSKYKTSDGYMTSAATTIIYLFSLIVGYIINWLM